MPVIVAIIGLFAPRLVIAGLWLLTDWFGGVFETRLWPILGFLLMPLTMLWFSAVQNWFNGEWGWLQIVILVLAIIGDLHSDKHTTTHKKRDQ